ncbi:radical SAM protein [Sorangium sp. So ce315]|uniref:radical SAM protein n=1 Tax=Sorangium sp. So ce315 TaxID=3133299 RepID=UPI003F6284E9
MSLQVEEPLPPAAFGRARDALARLAAAEGGPGGFRDLLEQAAPPGLPEDVAVAGRPVVLRSRASAAVALGAEARGAAAWAAAEGLDEAGRAALDVLLRRALDPVEALATWPLEALFTPDEAAWLRAARPSQAPATPTRLRWAPGQDMSYAGYACAIVKITRLCNLRCTYCHDWRAETNQIMTFPVQARLFQELIGSGQHGTIEVVWHGGEPTLLGQRAFLRTLALERWFQRPGQQIFNRIQTNATTIDDAWVRFFLRYGMHVGVSIDGPPELHDRTRLHVSGRATFPDVRRGLRLLRDAGLLRHVYLVIGGATLAAGAARIVRFLQEEGLTRVGVLPTRPGNGDGDGKGRGAGRPGVEWVDRATYVRFLLDLDRARKAQPEPWIHVRELDSAARAARGEVAGHCELLGNCVGAFFSIEPDGSVGHCDKFVGDPDYTLGNVLTQSFDEMRAGQRAQALAAGNRAAQAQQRGCRYFKHCRGWCPHERYVAERHDPAHDPSCCGLSELFQVLEEEAIHANGPRQ